MEFFECLTFNQIDYKKNLLTKGDYEECRFQNCNFETADISKINFINCVFINCNLSNANVNQSSFQEVDFKDCKIIGVRFETSSDFGFDIKASNSNFNLSGFYKKSMKKALFYSCMFQEVDFTEADLSQVAFEHCNFKFATFELTVLTQTDFRQASDYTINLEKNIVKGALFSRESIDGLLQQYGLVID